jgi:predicted ATPase/DNA-binding winged helix-turn-helix (wHTH) protein
MDDQGRSQAEDAIAFGPFRLRPRQRLLERDGRAVPLGGRAFDLLVALAGAPERYIGKKELIEQVWPDVTVDEGSLRFHMAMLRKALGDGRSGERYVETLPGRGYRFVAPVSRADRPQPVVDTPQPRSHNLPPSPARMVGRDGALDALVALLASDRLVTIVGPGGMGKTTLAVAVGHALVDRFEGTVLFVDLGAVADSSHVPAAVASTLGLLVWAPDPVAGITAFLRDRRALLILDGCEHLADAAAALAERIHAETPFVHILATSREALRAVGERVHRLAPLEAPPEQAGLSAAEALRYPAVQLFVERVAAGEPDFVLGDADAPAVAALCRSLDGVALAIELAAGRVGAYGVQETARLLDGQLHLLWRGRRTAVARHQTLAAALDWSHNLLAEEERVALRRLAVLQGAFSLEAARVVASGEGLDGEDVLDAVAGLVAKSLVSADASGPVTRYRLLDTTRAYARGKLFAAGEDARVAARHAGYFRSLLARLGAGTASEPSHAEIVARDRDHLGDVRAALEWSFGQGADVETGVALATAAAPLFMRLSLLGECRQWTERAIGALGEAASGTEREMELQAWLGQCLMFARHNGEPACAAFTRSLEIAEALGRQEHQVEILGWLAMLYLRHGDQRMALAYAKRTEAAAAALGDPLASAAAQHAVGACCHRMGRQDEAQMRLAAALAASRGRRSGISFHPAFGIQHQARIALARTLWLRGHADQASQAAAQAIEEATELGYPHALCIALLWASSVSLWRGDYGTAERRIDALVGHAERHMLEVYLATGLGLRGELAVRLGRAEEGVAALCRSLQALRRERYAMTEAIFALAITEGLASLNRLDEALATVEETIGAGERMADLTAMPELLRLKGEILARMAQATPDEAEAVLLRSLRLAASQGALAWELRTAMSLASLWSRQGLVRDAQALLVSVYGRFTEGFDTVDLRAAERLLGEIGGPVGTGDDPAGQHRPISLKAGWARSQEDLPAVRDCDDHPRATRLVDGSSGLAGRAGWPARA